MDEIAFPFYRKADIVRENLMVNLPNVGKHRDCSPEGIPRLRSPYGFDYGFASAQDDTIGDGLHRPCPTITIPFNDETNPVIVGTGVPGSSESIGRGCSHPAASSRGCAKDLGGRKIMDGVNGRVFP